MEEKKPLYILIALLLMGVAIYGAYEVWAWVYWRKFLLFFYDTRGLKVIHTLQAYGWWALKLAWPFVLIGAAIGAGLGLFIGYLLAMGMTFIPLKATEKLRADKEQRLIEQLENARLRQHSDLDGQRKKIAAGREALNQRAEHLTAFEQRVKAREDKAIADGAVLAKKLQAACVERDAARNRAKRLQKQLDVRTAAIALLKNP